MSYTKISVIGLGKLGSPLAGVLASKGYQVIGLDLNMDYVDAINAGRAPVEEPGLQSLIDKHKANLCATTSYTEAIRGSDVTFIIVPTPSLDHGMFSNAYVLKATHEIGTVLKKKQGYHLVVITSTVMPGSTQNEILKALESSSGRKVGADLGLCYNPEFIALGSVIKNMLYPDMILLGESDHKAGNTLASIYASVCENNPPIMRMNLVNAEITKIAVNTYVTTKISFANMLSDLCDRLDNADVEVVTKAMGLDQRIGQKYLQGATSYGGPCFPRDNIAFTALAKKLGARVDIPEATDAINDYQVKRLMQIIARHGHHQKIAILGLSYKPNTYVVEKSAGLSLANSLAEANYTVTVYDPEALNMAKPLLHASINKASSVESCVSQADIIIITTNWSEFKEKLHANLFQDDKKPRVIIDCWRILSNTNLGPYVQINFLGQGKKEKTGSGLSKSLEQVVDNVLSSMTKVEQLV